MALTTAQKLAEAEEALHALKTGKLVRAFVDQNGERVEFNLTSIAKLEAYVESLIGGATRGPIGFYF